MPGKVSPVPFSNASKNLGQHHAQSFNTDEPDDVREYSDLRTRHNDPASGVKIERIREIVKTETEVETDGNARHESKTDRLYLFVEWWESKPRVARGEADTVQKDFAVEWSPVVAELKTADS